MSENKKISELDLVTSNASGDIFPLVQNGVTMRTTMSKISSYLDGIFTTTSEVAAQITAAITGKENISNKQNNLDADVTNTKYPTVTATNSGLATKQSEYDLGNTETGTTNVSIDATSGVGVFTQPITRKTSAQYDINNTLVEVGVTKVEYNLFYSGAGYPLIMHCQILPSRIRFHIANIAVDGGAGIDTNADLEITFRLIN
jgi:tRNA/tmRNA/rRNA uracil-C5-methylase (TrmA/RlmC/RlmD family)